MRIDSHQHFWHYHPDQYGWIGPGMEALQQDFLPADLKPLVDSLGIEGVVSVQARQTPAETDWLLKLASRHPFIKGVVGWMPLTSARIRDHLVSCRDPALVGIRHILQDEEDEDFMLRPDFNRGIRALREFGLVYDILIYEHHLPQSLKLVDEHPDQVFVLDHVAKPSIRTAELSPWKERIQELALRPLVYCKISGMATEADWQNWSDDDLRPYLDTVLDAFGPRRLMFGSDWPVCLLACEYRRWYRVLSRLIASLSKHEQDRILGETAVEAYGLEG